MVPKQDPFIDFDKDLKVQAIGAFALLVILLKILTNKDKIIIVHTKKVNDYGKAGKKKERPSNAVKDVKY